MTLKNLRLIGLALLMASATTASAATQSMIKGLDHSVYLSYEPSVVRQTQEALGRQGLYKGEINGVLDPETMRATAEFQKQNGLHVSGVPTPLTRKKLAGGTS